VTTPLRVRRGPLRGAGVGPVRPSVLLLHRGVEAIDAVNSLLSQGGCYLLEGSRLWTAGVGVARGEALLGPGGAFVGVSDTRQQGREDESVQLDGGEISHGMIVAVALSLSLFWDAG